MDETNPVFENFRNKMRAFGRPIRETTRRVSASKFLGRDELEKKIEINARKITILKNIIQAQQVGIGEMLKSLSESSPIPAIEKEILDIKETVTSIKDTLIAQQEFEQELFNQSQRELERQRRRDRENLLETRTGRLGSFLKSTTQKIVDPVKNIFVGIIQFFATLFFGKFLVNFTKFLSNPKNIQVLLRITDFISNNFDAIITAVGLGTAAIALFSLKVLGIGAVLRNIVLGNIFGTPFSRVLGSRFGSTAATKGMPGAFSRGTRTGNYAGAPIGARFKGFKFFSRGGLVPGTGNVDSVPAMLTPGEIVISKPAVEKIGAINLLNLNREAGKTNVPKIRNGRFYANEGMSVPNINMPSLSGGSGDLISRVSKDKTKSGIDPRVLKLYPDLDPTKPGDYIKLKRKKIPIDLDLDTVRNFGMGMFGNPLSKFDSPEYGMSLDDKITFRVNEAIKNYNISMKPVSDPIIPSPPIEESDGGVDLSSFSKTLNPAIQDSSPSDLQNDIVQGDLAMPDDSVLSTIGMI